MGSVQFAVIGCGRIAGNHLSAIQEAPRAELVAVCDLIRDRAEGYGQKFGVPTYTNYRSMLQREEVDVVCILTPSGMHPTHAIDIMTRYGKHVVVEKPLALRLADLEAMREAGLRVGAKIFPVYQHRYNKAVRTVRAGFLGGAMGKAVLGTVRVRWCRSQSYYDRDPWRGTWSLDGGALTNQGIHYLDLLLHLMGDVEEVSGVITTRLLKVEVEDVAVATLKFSNGAVGLVEVTTAARPHDFEASVSVLAEKGTAVLGGIACNELWTWTLDPDACPKQSETFANVYGHGHHPFFKDVVADILDGVPHPISFQEGAGALHLLNAIYRSAEEGRAVRLEGEHASLRFGQPSPSLHSLYLTPPLPGDR